MLTWTTKVKVLAFVVISVLVLAYIGVRYADVGKYFGASGYYTVTLDLPAGGGLYTNAEVDYRGVPVGRVGAMNLTADGIEVDLHIDNSAPHIPGDVRAAVAERSVVGEQYVDLRPKRTSGPYLAAGSHIGQLHTSIPKPVTTLLTSVNSFAASVPKKSLRTVVSELDNAFAGEGDNLRALLNTTSDFTKAASADLPNTIELMNNSATVLRTQNAESGALVSFSHSMEKFAHQLASSDPDLRKLIAATPGAAQQVAGLLRDNDPSLSVVIANLLTVSNLTVTRQSGLKETLVGLPAAVAAGSTAVTAGGAQFGMALTFFNPLPCTAGYGGTTYRNGLVTSKSPALNTAARCTLPASSGVEVRGSAHAPGAGVPAPAKPGSVGADPAKTAKLPGALGVPGPAAQVHGMRGLLGLTGAGTTGGGGS